MNKIFFPISFLLFSCTPKEGEIYPEGSQAGDCTDGADNDVDGDFDCDDDDCSGSPDCEGE